MKIFSFPCNSMSFNLCKPVILLLIFIGLHFTGNSQTMLVPSKAMHKMEQMKQGLANTVAASNQASSSRYTSNVSATEKERAFRLRYYNQVIAELQTAQQQTSNETLLALNRVRNRFTQIQNLSPERLELVIDTHNELYTSLQ